MAVEVVGPSEARTLCRLVDAATDVIGTIAQAPGDVDTVECGLVAWGHLRVNALAIMLYTARDERASAELAQLTDAPSEFLAAQGPAQHTAAGDPIVPVACLRLLDSAASRTDLEGVRVAATLLRNLALPASGRLALGALHGGRAFSARVSR
jgi:hypothetical protein